MSEFPHLSPGSVRFQTSEVRVLEARNTITGTRVFIIEGPGAEALLPVNCRVLERHDQGTLVTLPFRLPGEKSSQAPPPAVPPVVTSAPVIKTPVGAPPEPALVEDLTPEPVKESLSTPPVATPPVVKPASPPPAPKKPVRKQTVQPAVTPTTKPAVKPTQPVRPATQPAPKRPPMQLPKLPRVAVYALIAVPLVVLALIFIIRKAPSGGGTPVSASIAHLVDIEVTPAGLPPARLVVDSAPKQSGIEPGTVLGSIPKRVVFSYQGDWVVHGEYDDQHSSPVTIRIPHDRTVTIVFPD